MIFKSEIKCLVTAALLCSFYPLVSVSAQENKSVPPEATTADAEISFWDLPYLEKSFIDSAPVHRSDEISVSRIGVDGGNKAMIIKLAQEIADGKHGNFDSLLIAHKGKLIFESYYRRGRINLPHAQASATKSYTSLALGRVIQLGYLTMDDLDKPLISFLKELNPEKFAKGAEFITLHEALTMTTGIRVARKQKEELQKKTSQIRGQKQVQAMFEHSAPITTESKAFLYGTGPDLVMQVIEAVVPGSAKDFIKNELLDKLGVINYGWKTAPNGLPEAGWRVDMTSRGMIKWGILVSNNGKWKGEQLIPENFIAKSTSRILYTGDDDVHFGGKDTSNQGYGYFWWGVDMKYGNKSYFGVSAQGGGGQLIMLIEELDLLIVMTAHDNGPPYKQIIAERILPAFAK